MRSKFAFSALAVSALMALSLCGCDSGGTVEPPPADETLSEDQVQPTFTEEEAKAAEDALKNQ